MNTVYYLGIDVGSASVRTGVYNAEGNRLAFATRPIKQFRPKPEFVEQSSTDIWDQICEATREAVARADVPTEKVRSIGIDATCSLVAVSEGGKPVSVSPADAEDQDIIMWMDHRAGIEAGSINATGHEALKYVGGEVSIEMELPKILWLKTHFPDRYAKVWRFFDLADYLVWRCTDRDVASTCTLTCKWNYLAHEKRFPEDMLAAVGLSDLPGKVPHDIKPLGEAVGTLNPVAAEQLGLHADVIVASGIIDAHAGGLALIGAKPEGGLAPDLGDIELPHDCQSQSGHGARGLGALL